MLIQNQENWSHSYGYSYYICRSKKKKVTEFAQRKLAGRTIVQQKLAGEHMHPQGHHRYMT